MTKHRTAPHPEWVLMYRKGLPSAKIAALCGVPSSTVRFHLQKAAGQEPGLREEHRRALAAAKPGPSRAAMRNLADVIALHQAEGRLPAPSGATARERTLSVWLARCRREAAAGTLSAELREGLSVVPGWYGPSARAIRDEARWRQRFEELIQLRAGGGDWPRHQKTLDEQERALGLWLHSQRISARHGVMGPAKVKLLDSALPGWREGRGRRGGRRPKQ
ncbi:helicase associated domain-containing protein [Pseudarthrobacter sp. NPDC092439]